MKVKIYSARHIKIESENDAEMVILEGLKDFKRATLLCARCMKDSLTRRHAL